MTFAFPLGINFREYIDTIVANVFQILFFIGFVIAFCLTLLFVFAIFGLEDELEAGFFMRLFSVLFFTVPMWILLDAVTWLPARRFDER